MNFMSRRFAHMLAFALIGAMLAPSLGGLGAIVSATPTAVDDPCGEFCICVPESTYGCIEEAPEAPQPAPVTPAPRSERIQLGLAGVHVDPIVSAIESNEATGVAPTRRTVTWRSNAHHVNDALALISVWRT